MNTTLSVLVPAYGYAEGVGRILSAFLDELPERVELLIADDSHDGQVEQLVSELSRIYPRRLLYRRNRPKLGAVANWNSLIEQARGEYLLLLHHDEFPIGMGFAHQVINLLGQYPDVDVLVLECLLCSPAGALRPHVPYWIRQAVLNNYPSYLFRRNVVGPASSLVVKRELYPRFDERLCWLVDVDLYYRLRLLTSRWMTCKGIAIASVPNREDSITSRIRHELKSLDAEERAYLGKKYPDVRIWLEPERYRTWRIAESVVWCAMRMVTFFYYIVSRFSGNAGNTFIRSRTASS